VAISPRAFSRLALANFAAMNAVYSKYFSEPYPARSTIQVAGLPRGSQVEIEIIAAA